MGTTTGPTPAQIAIVQTNLKNMQALNGYVYNQGQSKILNAYFLLSETDNGDPGLVVGLNILEGAFWAIGSEFGPIGNFAASFLSGMLSWWATSTPPSLNTTFASLLTRTQATSLAVDTQLATYYADVAANWNVSFTYNGVTTSVSALADISFPAETDPDFETLAAKALVGLDQSVWTTVLDANFQCTTWETSQQFILQGSEDSPPVSWAEGFIASNPAYYVTWVWHKSTGCGDQTGWLITEISLGGAPNPFSDAAISKDACSYLFIDSAPGVVINPNGLFTRETVFTGLNIKQGTYIVVTGGGMPLGQLSAGYLRAMKQGRTLGALIAREGRSQVEQRVVAQAHGDPIFSHDLAMRPRQTLERFLDVKIPEVVTIDIVVEGPRHFGLVIPAKNS